MQLSPRLEKIMEMAGSGNAVADIGTDHGYVPLELVRRGAFQRAYAMDVRKGPLERAREHIQMAGMSERIETRLSDGLEKLLPGEADVIVMAGMGGPLMQRLLIQGEQTARSAKNLILSPQSEVERFRRFLHENRFRVVDEVYIEDENKIYVVMRCISGEPEEWTDLEFRYGKYPWEVKDALLLRILEKEIRTADSILEELKKQDSVSAEMRSCQLRKEREIAVWARELMLSSQEEK